MFRYDMLVCTISFKKMIVKLLFTGRGSSDVIGFTQMRHRLHLLHLQHLLPQELQKR